MIRSVAAPTTAESCGAAVWSRAAVFTTSPATIASPRSDLAPSVTTASPVLTPIRTESPRSGPSSFNSAMASRMRKPARTARSASSSWAVGAPNTAITASPMNFSTVPPSRSISFFRRSW